MDLVVSTHPDNGHSSGLAPVIEERAVGQLGSLHKPWEHTYDIAKMFQDGRVTDMSVAEGIRKSLNVRYLEKLAKRRTSPSSGRSPGCRTSRSRSRFLGPTKAFTTASPISATPAPKCEKHPQDAGRRRREWQ